MSNDKDSAVHGCQELTLAEQLINFLDDTDWELSAFVRENANEILNALRQPTQGDAEIIAENKRLREALAHIANTINIVGSPYHKAQEALDQIVTETKRAARAALKEQSK